MFDRPMKCLQCKKKSSRQFVEISLDLTVFLDKPGIPVYWI